MNCGICERPLYPGRAIFRCQCGVLSHAYCWEKHVVQSHGPSFTLGYMTVGDEFRPKEGEPQGSNQSAEKEPSATEKVSENLQKGETALQAVPEVARLAAEQTGEG